MTERRPESKLCAICGCSEHMAVHRPIIWGERKGKPLGHTYQPQKTQIKGLGACPISRATKLEIKPNEPGTENRNRDVSEEKLGAGKAGGRDAVRASGFELGTCGCNLAEHRKELTTGAAQSSDSAAPTQQHQVKKGELS